MKDIITMEDIENDNKLERVYHGFNFPCNFTDLARALTVLSEKYPNRNIEDVSVCLDPMSIGKKVNFSTILIK